MNVASETRIEYRAPDPACNPYLVFAVMLAAGLRGIENEYELPPEAIQAAEGSDLLRDALGDHVFDKIEWDNYRRHITDDEIKHKLPTL